MKVSKNCGGSCEPKDWNKVFEEYFKSELAAKVIKGKNNRLLVTTTEGLDTTEVVFAW
jgi:hypothetical protein